MFVDSDEGLSEEQKKVKQLSDKIIDLIKNEDAEIVMFSLISLLCGFIGMNIMEKINGKQVSTLEIIQTASPLLERVSKIISSTTIKNLKAFLENPTDSANEN